MGVEITISSELITFSLIKWPNRVSLTKLPLYVGFNVKDLCPQKP